MKNISSALKAYLINTNGLTNTQFIYMDLYVFQLSNGTTLYYTSADTPVAAVYDGHAYTSLGPKLQRDSISTMVGVQVDQLDITVMPETTDLVLGVPFLTATWQGVFDGAWVTLNRLFLSAWPASPANQVGVVNLFSGNVSDIALGRSQCKMTIKSPFERFNLQLPRNLYQPGCVNTLFDGACKLSQAAFTTAGTVTVIPNSSPSQIFSSSLPPLPFYYALGVITFTSGLNNGISRTIKSHEVGTPSAIQLFYSLPNAPANGDTFTISPGCDKQQSTCGSAKFNNIVNFRGMPYVPVPETAT